MATAQKSSSGGKRVAGGTKTKKKSTTSKSTTQSSRKKQAPPPAAKPVRREVGAVACLFVGLLAALGYFNLDGVAINLICNLFSGLLGFGFYFVPPAFFITAGILFMHRGRPVRFRITCCLLLPLVMSCLMQLFFSSTLPETQLISTLWASGLARTSSGLLGGALSMLLIAMISKVGTGIVLVLLLLFLIISTWDITIADIVDYIINRPRPEYYEEDYEQPEPPRKPEPAPAKRRKNVDIPLDGEPPAEPQPVATPAASAEVFAPPAAKKEKPSFFRRRSDKAQSPDELLRQIEHIDAPLEVQPDPAETPAPEPTPASAPVQAPAAVDLPPLAPAEPVLEKVKPAEAAAAARAVASEIDQISEKTPMPYHYPPLNLLQKFDAAPEGEVQVELAENAERLSATIASFGIDARMAGITRGPSVTRYEIELDQGVRLNKLTNLADDIALALGASGVRISPIPGKISMVGIEVPNKLVSPVPLGAVIGSPEFQNHKSNVCFAVGKDIGDHVMISDISRLPHLLIAGTTGSGKSVCTNSIIVSLLYKSSPEQCRFIMVDPKMVELNVYNGIPHLLIPVVTDPKKAAGALQWAVTEMLKRYQKFSEIGVRDLSGYNNYAAAHEMEAMPQIVIIIDELADLMLVAAKEVEESICRVAQMGRASGMHLIIATQRPSADVITGLMKANIPSRIAFAVASSLESRIILDHVGAEKLVGRGDMLYLPVGAGKPQRVQGTLVSDREIAAVVEYVKRTGESNYNDDIMSEIELRAAQSGSKGSGGASLGSGDSLEDEDDMLTSAIEVVLDSGIASVSMLQRRLKVGHSRAGRLMDTMEEKGIVGPHEGSKSREILITKEQWQERQLRTGDFSSPPPQEPEPVATAPIEPQDTEEEAEPSFDDLPPFDVGDME